MNTIPAAFNQIFLPDERGTSLFCLYNRAQLSCSEAHGSERFGFRLYCCSFQLCCRVSDFIVVRQQLLNNNKVGNPHRPFYAQNLRNLRPCEKIKSRTGRFACSFRIGVVYNKVENSMAHARVMAGPHSLFW